MSPTAKHRAWRRLRTLDAQDWRVLAASAFLLPAVWVGLRLFGIPRGTHSSRVSLGADPRVDPQRMAWLVNAAAARHPLPVTCLSRSVLLAWMLSRRGVATQLRIGVRPRDGSLLAHAWLEHEGRPLNDSPAALAGFAVFDSPIPLRAFGRS